MDGFLITPKPRELTEEEVDKFKLTYYSGKKIKPAYESTGNVWAAANNGKLPTYRFYDHGTNWLTILKYTPDNDVWEEVKMENIHTLYSIVWLMCLKLQEKNEPFDLKQCKHYRVKKGGEWSTYGHYDIYYKCLDCNSIFYQDQTSTDEWNALKEKENKQ